MLQKRKDTKSINQINFMAILFAGLFAFISACLVIVNEYMDFQKEIKIVEENYIQTQHKSAQTHLLLLHNITAYRFSKSQGLSKEQMYQKLKEDIAAIIPKDNGQNYLFLEQSSGKMLYRTAALLTEDSSKDIVITELFEPLDLILGSGVSTHSIEDVLAEKKKAYQDKIINFVLKIYMLTFFLYLISTVEYRYVSDIMKREIRFIVYSFKKASQSYEFIDMEKIKFQEFQEIVTHANVMIEEIKTKNNDRSILQKSMEY